MKKEKKKKSIFTYILKGLLCLIVTIIPVFSYGGEIATPSGNRTAVAESTEPTVWLEWGKDTTVNDGIGVSNSFRDNESSVKMTVLLKLKNADAESTVKVRVATYDVSARADYNEYVPLDEIYTLSANSDTKEIKITVSQQRDAEGTAIGLTTWIGRTAYTKIFGVRIVSVENALVDHERNSLLGNVLCDWWTTLFTVDNSSLDCYSSSGFKDGGVSYSSVAKEYRKSFSFNKSNIGTEESTIKEFRLPDLADLDSGLALLQTYYGSQLEYYYNFSGKVASSIGNLNGVTFEIYEIYYENGTQRKNMLYSDEWGPPAKDGSFYDLPKEGGDTNKGIQHGMRNSDETSKYFKYNSGRTINFYFRNNSLLGPTRSLYNWGSNIIIDNNVALEIEEYRMDTGAYGYGDEVYIAVRFNKAVQVQNSKGFQLRTKINGIEAIFDYAGGNYTDTLYFKKSFDGTTTYNGTSVDIIGFSGTDVKIYDLFLNKNNSNNVASSLPNSLSNKVVKTLTCTIDTRSPKVSCDYNSPLVLKSHDVPVNVSDVTEGARMDICWSENDRVDAGIKWSNIQFVISDDPKIVTGSLFTGTMYLHVRVTSASGRQTVRTFGPYKFDNNPPKITSITVADPLTYQKEHAVEAVFEDYEAETYISKVYFIALNDEMESTSDLLVFDYDDQRSNKMSNEGGNIYKINVTDDMVGLAENSYGGFKLGFKVVDSLGNESIVKYTNSFIAFDNRVTFSVNTDLPTSVSTIEFGSHKIIQLDGNENTSYPFVLYVTGETVGYENIMVKSLSKNGTLIDGSEIESRNTAFDVASWKKNDSGKLTMNFLGSAEGYYDIILSADEKESQIIRLFFTNKNSSPENYSALYAEDRLLANEVWRFATDTFYKFGAEPVNYVDGEMGIMVSRNFPIFSTKDKALEYAKFKEYQDLTPIVLTASQAQQLESGTNSAFMKAIAPEVQNVTAEEGQLWIRYKSTNWKVDGSSANSSSSWVYYYYKDGLGVEPGTTPVISDVKDLPTYLEEAVTVNAKKICGYDGSPYYLTVNNGHQSSGSALTYEKKAIFFEPLTYSQGFTNPVKYSGDPDIYDNTVNVDVGGRMQEVAYVKAYTLDFICDFGAVYYRLLGSDTYLEATYGERLQDILKTTGVYEFVEIAKGYKSYYVYYDTSEPILFYDFTHQDSSSATVSYLDKTIEGTVFNAKEVTLKGILYDSNVFEGYTSEIDEYAYVCVMNSNGTGLVKFMTMKQLHEMRDGYPLSTGTYQIYVYDRLGNGTYMTIRIKDESLNVTSNVTENFCIRFYFNRKLTEIREETFAIYRDNRLLDVAYAEELTFKESGTYRIVLTDIYGYSIDETFEFTRDYPELRFYYINKDGRYQEVVPVEEISANEQKVAVLKEADNAYLIVSANDIRITYDNQTDYVVQTVLGEPEIEIGGINSVTLDIAGDGTDWTIRIAYADDPLVYVTVVCSYDTEAPIVEAFSETDDFEFNDENGKENVLFQANGTKTVGLLDGDRINTDSITLFWTDENQIGKAYYIKHGEEELRVDIDDPNVGEYVINGVGEYTFYVTDLIGNTSTFHFTLAETLDLTYFVGDEEIAFETDPLTQIDGDVYKITENTGKAVRFYFKNDNGHAAFVWSNGTDSYVYYVDCFDGEITIGYLLGEETIVIKQLDKTILQGVLVEQPETPFRLYCGIADGKKYLEVPAPEEEYIFWQFRIADTKYVSPVIAQFVQSNVLPEVILKEADGELVEESVTDFVGVNSAVGVLPESVTDSLESVVAYRKDAYTMDFSDAEEYYLYNNIGKTYASISDHGYYKIVATNKYGNQQIMYIRLSFELDVNVLLEYADGEQRTYTLGREKEQSFRSNKLVNFSVWDTECEISVTKDGSEYLPEKEYKTGSFRFDLTQYGEYVVTAIDSCGNRYTLTVSLQEPTEVVYEDYLTDFNEDALYKEQLYSNAPVSIDLAAIEDGAIGYVSYRYVDGNRQKAPKVVLYDVISQNSVGYSEENFLRSIGKEGDGSYEVTFSDHYGNKLTVTVKISTAERLVITRTTQNAVRADAWTVADALEIGVWSNRLVTLTDNAQASSLSVDGETVSFENGKYVLEYPNMAAVEDVQRRVVYVDEYGNKYQFTVHLYRKTPEEEFVSEKTLIALKGEPYVQGAFSYVWTDEKVTATCAVDMGEVKPYDSGTIFTEDAYYAFTFTDIAGNEATRTVIIDTTVSYTLRNGGTTICSGATVNGTVSLFDKGEELTVTSAEKDGKRLETDRRNFSEHGEYKLLIRDALGNTETLEFTVYNHAMNSFAYTANEDYSIIQVWYHRDEGLQSYVSDVVMDETQTRHVYEFKLEGLYDIDLYHNESGEIFTFSVTIDDTKPTATLVGVEQGEATRKNVSFKGLQVGDVVKIYEGKELLQTFKVETDGQSPTIEEAGSYRVVITDAAGNTTEYAFTREFTTNAASNVLIILLLSLTVAGGFIYIVLREKNKVK